ncbi:MAG: tetratricopeptide repeat protein [Candidatus Micrarchaeia archaeon]|jgi:tetratricopeptide (TPR) repeat protein
MRQKTANTIRNAGIVALSSLVLATGAFASKGKEFKAHYGFPQGRTILAQPGNFHSQAPMAELPKFSGGSGPLPDLPQASGGKKPASEGIVPASQAGAARVREEAPASDSLVAAADSLIGRGKVGKAIKAYTQAVHADTLNADAWLGLGKAYEMKNVFFHGRRALACIHEADRLRPGNAEIMAEMAKAYMMLGRTRCAVDKLEEAVRLHPGEAGIRYMLSRIYLFIYQDYETSASTGISEEGALALAREHMAVARERQPDDALFLYYSALVEYFSGGNLAQALLWLGKAEEILSVQKSDRISQWDVQQLSEAVREMNEWIGKRAAKAERMAAKREK